MTPPEKYPLVFWLGPFRLLTVRVPVVIENYIAEPGLTLELPGPDFACLERRARGVYRRSQPLGIDQNPVAPGALVYVVSRYPRSLIAFAGTFQDYLGTFSAKTRSTLKRKVRKFAEASGGQADFRVYRTPREIAEFYGFAREISRYTYQEKLFGVGLPDRPGFQQELSALAEADQVRGFLLFFKGVPISYLFCPAEDLRLNYTHLGFRPEYAEYSPGAVLQFLSLEFLFSERRFALLDLGEGGEGQHKRIYATHTVPCANVLYLRPTIANRLLIRSHQTWTRVADRLDRTLADSGLKRGLKRWLRGQNQSLPVAETASPP